MREFWAVFRLELRLLLRSWGIWVAGLVPLFFGVWEATMAREFPFDAWSQFTVAVLFVTLILTLTTGGQVTRDRDRHIDGVLLSTPATTQAYVWGKYLAALVVLLGLAALMLPGAILMDRFTVLRDPPAVLGHSHYPSLGPWPYVSAWLILVVVPIVFGAALSLACVTLTHGQRVISSIVVIVLWLGPAMLSSAFSGGLATLFDVVGGTLYGSIANIPLPPSLQNIVYFSTPVAPSPEIRAEVVRIVVAHLPPELPGIFTWNRALFVALAVALALLTVRHVRAQRRGA